MDVSSCLLKLTSGKDKVIFNGLVSTSLSTLSRFGLILTLEVGSWPGVAQGNFLKAEGRIWKIGLVGAWYAVLAISSKEKASHGLRESPVPYKGILEHENGTLILLDAYFGKDSI
jgi:hypothetical protein